MSISEVGVYLARIPFRFSFRHARASRKDTVNLILKVNLSSGVKGFGEGIPREYVTGETALSSLHFLEKNLIERLKGLSFEEKDIFLKALEQAIDGFPLTARCAVELACLDAFSRSHNVPLHRLFTSNRDPHSVPDIFCYSGIMSAEGLLKSCVTAVFFKMYGFKEIKLKVGFKNDTIRLRALRAIAGDGVDIRLDANGAWKAEEAIESIKAMEHFKPTIIEQPVEALDLAGFKKVTAEAGIKTMADESLRTPAEAERLAREKICHSFNIRLSKCGGFLQSIKIAEIAERYGLSFQIGCHVGETGILSAAGRHLAACLPEAIYLEGGYSKFLLKEDIVREDTGFRKGGMASQLSGSGLGIDLVEERLNKYLEKQIILKN